MQPKVAVSAARQPPARRELFDGKYLQYVEESLLRALFAQGLLPVIVPGLGDERAAGAWLEGCAGLVLSGGEDVAPALYGEEPRRPEWAGCLERDLMELSLLHAAIERGLPVLGICRGCQLLAVAHGGRLHQDVASDVPGALVHRDPERYDRLEHEVRLASGSRLARWLGGEVLRVNSVHHQAIRDPGAGLVVVATAPDGVVEAIENQASNPWLLGVQWHPEWMAEDHGVLAGFADEVRARPFSRTSHP